MHRASKSAEGVTLGGAEGTIAAETRLFWRLKNSKTHRKIAILVMGWLLCVQCRKRVALQDICFLYIPLKAGQAMDVFFI